MPRREHASISWRSDSTNEGIKGGRGNSPRKIREKSLATCPSRSHSSSSSYLRRGVSRVRFNLGQRSEGNRTPPFLLALEVTSQFEGHSKWDVRHPQLR